jgi:predicted secreted hydrolase
MVKRTNDRLNDRALRRPIADGLVQRRPGRVRRWRITPLLILSLLVLLATACQPVFLGTAPAPAPGSVAVPAAPPLDRPAFAPVTFPLDDSPHDSLTEWWYYTGHLFGPDGERYGFEFVIFQSVRGLNPVGYAAHFAITDHQTSRFSYDERVSIGSQIGKKDGVDLTVGDWRLQGANGDDQIDAAMPGYHLRVTTRSLKPATLHNDIGFISFGPAGDSYYYSRTRLDVTGTLEVDGREVPVTGLAWMDHQWGDFITAGGGWDWFAVQLSDGSDLKISIVRDDEGDVVLTFGTYVSPIGETRHVTGESIGVDATGSWQSPRTGVVYPSGWRIRVEDLEMNLVLDPVLLDQELVTDKSTGVIYWEGEVEIQGDFRGQPVTGHGYVELLGYTAPGDTGANSGG